MEYGSFGGGDGATIKGPRHKAYQVVARRTQPGAVNGEAGGRGLGRGGADLLEADEDGHHDEEAGGVEVGHAVRKVVVMAALQRR